MNYHWLQKRIYNNPAPRENLSLKVDDIPGARPKFMTASKKVDHYRDKLRWEELGLIAKRPEFVTFTQWKGAYEAYQGQSQKKHFNMHQDSEISRFDLLREPDLRNSYLDIFDYPRNLWTKDIPGARAGTLKSRAVRNNDLANRIRTGDPHRQSRTAHRLPRDTQYDEMHKKDYSFDKVNNFRVPNRYQSRKDFIQPNLAGNYSHIVNTSPLLPYEKDEKEEEDIFASTEKKRQIPSDENILNDLRVSFEDQPKSGQVQKPYAKLAQFFENSNPDKKYPDKDISHSHNQRAVSFSPTRDEDSTSFPEPPYKSALKNNYHYTKDLPKIQHKSYSILDQTTHKYHPEIRSPEVLPHKSASYREMQEDRLNQNNETTLLDVSASQRDQINSSIHHPEHPTSFQKKEPSKRSISQDQTETKAAGRVSRTSLLRDKMIKMKKVYVFDIISNQPQVRMIPANSRCPNRYGYIMEDESPRNTDRNDASEQEVNMSYRPKKNLKNQYGEKFDVRDL